MTSPQVEGNTITGKRWRMLDSPLFPTILIKSRLIKLRLEGANRKLIWAELPETFLKSGKDFSAFCSYLSKA